MHPLSPSESPAGSPQPKNDAAFSLTPSHFLSLSAHQGSTRHCHRVGSYGKLRYCPLSEEVGVITDFLTMGGVVGRRASTDSQP
jgi:hypothetical protein